MPRGPRVFKNCAKTVVQIFASPEAKVCTAQFTRETSVIVARPDGALRSSAAKPGNPGNPAARAVSAEADQFPPRRARLPAHQLPIIEVLWRRCCRGATCPDIGPTV